MQQIVSRMLGLLYRPTTEFEAALSEEQSVGSLFLQIVLPLGLADSIILAVQTSLRNGFQALIIGIAVTFFSAWALVRIAHLLESDASFVAAFRIASYTAPISFVAALLALMLPKLALPIGLIAAIYTIYVTWAGCAVTLARGRAVATRATAGTMVEQFREEMHDAHMRRYR